MNKRLRKIVSILCLVTMLFGNLSLDSFFGGSRRYVEAEETAVINPLERVDAKMAVGNTTEGRINAGETYNIRLTTARGKVLTLEAEGMKLWVDLVNEATGDTNRYTTKDGVLQVKWVAKTDSYLLIFGAQENGAAGKFTVSVTAEGENAAEEKPEETVEETPVVEQVQEEEKADTDLEQKQEEAAAEGENQGEETEPETAVSDNSEADETVENKETTEDAPSENAIQEEADSDLNETTEDSETEIAEKQEEESAEPEKTEGPAEQAEEVEEVEKTTEQAEKAEKNDESVEQAEEPVEQTEEAEKAEETEAPAEQTEEAEKTEEPAEQTEEAKQATELKKQAGEEEKTEESTEQTEESEQTEEPAEKTEEGELTEEPTEQTEEGEQTEEPTEQTEEGEQIEEPTEQTEEGEQTEEPTEQTEEGEQTEEPTEQTEEGEQTEEPTEQTEEGEQTEEPTEQTEEPTEQTEEPTEQTEESEKTEEPAEQTEEGEQTQKPAEQSEEGEQTEEPTEQTEEGEQIEEPTEQTEEPTEQTEEGEQTEEPTEQTEEGEKTEEPTEQTVEGEQIKEPTEQPEEGDQAEEPAEQIEEGEKTEETGVSEVTGTDVQVAVIDGELPVGTTVRMDPYSGYDLEALISLTSGIKSRNALRASKAAPANENVETGKLTGHTAFGVTLYNEGEEIHEGQFAITVDLPDVEMLGELPENADPDSLKYGYELYHIVDGVPYPVENYKVDDQDGIIHGIFFETNSLSDFVLKYTVDFHYKGTDYSIEGYSQILLSELIEILHITVEDGDTDPENDPLLNVADVAEVRFSDEHLVDVQEVSGLITYNSVENINIGDKDFLLTSLEPFTTEEVLNIILVDGTEIVVGVTDEGYITFNFYDEDGISPANPDMNGYTYVVAAYWGANYRASNTLSTNGGNSVSAYLDYNNGDDIYLLKNSWTGGDSLWQMDRIQINNANSFELGNYTVTKIDDYIYKAVKNPTYSTAITYYLSDGDTIDPAPSLSAGYYIVAKTGNDWAYYAEIGTDGSLTWKDTNHNPISELPAISEFKLCKPDNTSSFDQIKNANSITGTDTYDFILTTTADENNVYQFTAQKKPVYEVEIVFDGDDNPSGINGNYSIYAGVDAENINHQNVRYYNSQTVTLNGVPSQTIPFSSFNRSNDNPNSVSYTTGMNVNVSLVKDLQIEANGDSRGVISGGDIISSGGTIGEYSVTITTEENKTTITLKKLEPYHWKVQGADEHHVEIEPALKNNLYLVSTLTKGDGSGTYYHVSKVTLNNQGHTEVTGDIATYYTKNNVKDLNEILINNPSGDKTAAYQDGDTVRNVLVTCENAENYADVIRLNDNATIYDNGDTIAKYRVTNDNPDTDGNGVITLSRISDLRVKTEFKDENGDNVAVTDLHNDYYILLKMTDAEGETAYALWHVTNDANPSDPMAPGSSIEFKKYNDETYALEDGPRGKVYYTGSETITTQVVIPGGGNLALDNDLVNGTKTGVAYYNVNNADGSEGHDLTRDLYTSTSSRPTLNGVINSSTGVQDYILTTTFNKNPNNGIPHDLKVNFYSTHTDDYTTAVPGPAVDLESGQYFFRVRLYNNGRLVAYKLVPVTPESLDAAEATGTFTQTIKGDEAFTLVDDKGVDIDNASEIYYDPSIYTSDVRLYKVLQNKIMPTNLQDISDNATDSIPGYDFWYNNETRDPATGTPIVKTGHEMGLYSAHQKLYQVKITIDDPDAVINAADNLDLRVTAEHKTTNDDIFEVDNIPGNNIPGTYDGAISVSSESGTENGEKVYTYNIEQAGYNRLGWTVRSESEAITGNENFTLELIKGATKTNGRLSGGTILTEGYMVKVGDDYYSVSYDTGDKKDVNLFYDDDHRLTTIIHYIHLTKVSSFEKALEPDEVLGDAAEYGIVANRYDTEGSHTETNFAVNELIASGIDITGSGHNKIPFYVAQVTSGKIQAGTNVDADVYATPEAKNALEVNPRNNSTDYVNFIPKTAEQIDNYIDKMVAYGRSKSIALKNKPSITPEMTSGGTLDVSTFPDETTIYVDASNMELGGDLWTIKKLPGQSIVFNIPGNDVTINKFQVLVVDENGEPVTLNVETNNAAGEDITGVANNPVQSTTDALNGDAINNQGVDDVILSHITFNAYEAKNLHIVNASGQFLAPNATTVTNLNGAGWILAKGTVKGNSEWHFYRHDRSYTGVQTGFEARKFMKRMDDSGEYAIPTDDQIYTFIMEKLNPVTGEWEYGSSDAVHNDNEKIFFPQIDFGNANDQGNHYYRVREAVTNLSNIESDPTQYIVKVDVKAIPKPGQMDGTYTMSVLKTYYTVTDAGMDAADFIEQSDEEEVYKVGADGKLVANNGVYEKETVTHYRVNPDYLVEKGKDTEENEVDSADVIKFYNAYIGRYCVAVTKAWDDQNDRDGVRPDALKLELYGKRQSGMQGNKPTYTWTKVTKIAPEEQYTYSYSATDGSDTTTYVDYVLLNDANNWTAVVKGVDRYDEYGHPIEYVWVERAFVFGDTEIEFNVDEDDLSETDTLTIEYWVSADGQAFSQTEKSGYTKVSYTSKVTSIDAKITPEDNGTLTFLTGLKNTHEAITIEVQATKKWDIDGDDNADEGETPAAGTEITLRLIGVYTVDEKDAQGNVTQKEYEVQNLAVRDIVLDGKVDQVGGSAIAATATGETAAWVAHWGSLPKFYDGHLITYKVVEVEMPEGYISTAETEVVCELNDNGIWEAKVINTMESGELKVSKAVFLDNVQIKAPAEGADATEEYNSLKDKNYYFTVTRTVVTPAESEGAPDIETIYYVIPGADAGDPAVIKAEADVANNEQYLSITIDETVLFKKLPLGEYTVTEYVQVTDDQGIVTYEAVTDENGKINSWKFISLISDTTVAAQVAQGKTAEAELVNRYTSGKYCVSVTKQWLVNGEVSVPDDSQKLTVKLQRTTTPEVENSWADVDNIHMGSSVTGNSADSDTARTTIELNKQNNWSAVAVGMEQMDSTGTRYSYRWVEVNVDPAGWAEGKQTTVQSTNKDGTTLIFLTKLTNSRINAEIPVKKLVTGDYTGDESFKFTLAEGTNNPQNTTDQTDPLSIDHTEVSIKRNETGVYTITGITKPGTYTYTITETAGTTPGMTYDTAGKTVTFTVEADTNGILTVSGLTDGVAALTTVTNSFKTGELEISKTVVSDNPADHAQAFTFKVELKKTDGSVLADGTYGGVTVSSGIATIPLHGGDSVKLTDLPEGTTYTVTETAVDGFKTTVGGTETKTASGTISDTTPSSAAFTNTRDTGSLTVTKTVDSPLADDAEATYTFTITLDADISKTYDGVAFNHGVATFTLTGKNDGNTKTITGLPTGVYYTVTEKTVDGMTTSWTGNTGTVSTTGATAAATNKRDTGSLEIDKSVFVDGADKTSVYSGKTFYVKVFGVIDGTTYYVTDSNGTLSKTAAVLGIKPGTTLTISDLPAGEYTVTEVNSDGSAITNKPDTEMGAMTFLLDLSRKTDNATVIKGGTGKASIVNAYTAGKYCIAVTKQWLVNGKTYVDDNLTLKVKLQRKLATATEWEDVEGQIDITLDKANNWSYDATGMDQLDKDGVRYQYKWVETGIPEGWAEAEQVEVQVNPDVTTKVYLTKLVNTKAVAQPEVIKKVTGDTTAPSYNKNEEFTFKLVAKDGAPMPADGTTVSIKAGETGVFGEISYDTAGVYEYTITETQGSTNGMTYSSTPVKVTVTVTKDNTTGVLTSAIAYDPADKTVTNTYELASLNVIKVVDGLPDAIARTKIYLVSVKDAAGNYHALNGAVTGTEPHWIEITNAAAGITWQKLPAGTYTVTEKVAFADEPGYTLTSTTYQVDSDTASAAPAEAEITNGSEATVTITNTYEKDTTKASVTKVWSNPNNDPAAEIPDSLKVYLLADSHRVKDEDDNDIFVTLLKNDDWAAKEITGLDKYDASGEEISYTWSEDTVPDGWTFSGATTTGTLTTLTNTYAPGKTSVSVQKIWDDNSNQDNSRPAKVYVQLSGSAKDDDDKPVTVDLAAEGITTVVELNEGNQWRHTWDNLNQKTVEGFDITYTVTEVKDGDGTPIAGGKITFGTGAEYTVAVSGDASSGFTVTNTYVPETVDVPVIKLWDDFDDSEGLRDDITITVYLYADERPVAMKVLSSEDKKVNGLPWSWIFTGLPVNELVEKEDGTTESIPITYTVIEHMGVVLNDTYVEVGNPVYNKNGYDLDETINADGVWEITNKYEPKTEVTVNKIWVDENNQDGKRPNVSVQLYRVNDTGSETLVGSAALNDGNRWTYTWTDLLKYYWTEGDDPEVKAYEYTVKEVGATEEIDPETGNPTGKLVLSGLGDAVYTVTITKKNNEDGSFTIEIVNSYTPEKKTIKATKVWAGDENSKDLRKDVSLTLTGTYVVDGVTHKLNINNATKTITANAEGEALTVTWPDLSVYREGAEIAYEVTEAEIEGYTTTYGELTKGENGIWTIEITNTLDTGSLKIDKSVFVDGADKTSVYSEKIFYVKVFGVIDGTTYYVTNSNGTLSKTDNTKVLGIKPGTTLTISNLPAGEYTVTEVNSNGSEITTKPDTDMGAMTFLLDLSRKTDNATVIKGGTGEASIVNAYTASKYCIAVTKQWLVNGKVSVPDDQTLQVKLQRSTDGQTWSDVKKTDYPVTNGLTIDDDGWITLNKANNWSAVAVGMDQMDANGNRYQYQWVEETPTGWAEAKQVEVQANPDVTTKVYLTKLVNTKAVTQPEVIKAVTGDTTAPSYNKDEKFTFTLAAVEGAPMPDGGTTVNVKAGENGVFGEISYTEAGEYKYTITETMPAEADRTPGMTYNATPVNVTVTVVADDKGVLTATVAYDPADKTVTNTYELASLNVVKVVDGLPDAIAKGKIFLVSVKDAAGNYYALNGAVTGTEPHWIEITNAAAGITWQKLPAGTYTVTEKVAFADVPGYTLTSTTYRVDSGADGANPAQAALTNGNKSKVTITNTYGQETTAATVIKEWDDENNAEGHRPQSLSVTLLANGKAAKDIDGTDVSAVTLPVNDAWTATVQKLPKFDNNGDEITYTWTEGTLPKGYSLTGTSVSGTVTTLTNTYAPGETSVQVTKIWDDNDNQDGKRPTSVFVQLTATAEGAAVTLDRKDLVYELKPAENWTYIWTHLPEETGTGKEIAYSVAEVQDAQGTAITENKITFNGAEYTVTIGGDAATGYTVTNSYTPEVTQVPVTKIWDDNNDQDGVRPKSVTVILYADGKPVEAYTLKETDQEVNGQPWSHIFKNLPKYADSTLITYTVKEFIDVTLNTYEQASVKNVDGVWVITNKHVPETVELTVVKVWDDADDQDGIRPDSISVTLKANDGNPQTVDLNENGDWSYIWNGLPKYADGTPIHYTVDEAKVNGYENPVIGDLKQTGDNTYEVVVTNTHVPETVEITIQKIWVDENDNSGLRPAHVDVKLLADNQLVKTVRIEGDEWSYIENGLPKYAGGKEIKYTFEEYDVDYYEEKVGKLTPTGENTWKVEITNTLPTGDLAISKTVVSPVTAEANKDFTFTILLNEKVNGKYDATDGTSSEKVTFTDGEATIIVKGGQTKTIKGLPQGVKYTVVEAVPAEFDAVYKGETGTIEEGKTAEATITNTRKTGSLKIQKTVQSSNAADENLEFHFIVTLTGAVVNEDEPVVETYSGVKFTNGVSEAITLKHGESKVIEGLPVGIEYVVAESEKNENNFVTTSVGETGSICRSESIAAFTNTKVEGGLVVSKKVVSGLAADHEEAEFTAKVTLDDLTIGGDEGQAFGEATFINGIATLVLKDGETAVIEGLPKGLGYEVEEVFEDEEGLEDEATAKLYTVKYTGKTGTIKENKTAHAGITNTRNTGKLALTKKVESPSGVDHKAVYQFRVTLTNAEETLNGTYGGYTFEDGSATIGLRDGQTVVISQIPYGTAYEVAELFAEGDDRFEVKMTVDGEETDKAAGTIGAETTAAAVTFTNNRKTATLPVSKTVISPIEADKTKEFSFTIQLNERITGTFEATSTLTEKAEPIAFTDGRAEIKVKGTETKTITGLPEGVGFTIIEAREAFFNAEKAVQGGKVSGKTIAFTNTREEGKLEVTKTVESTNDQDREKEFTFRVTLKSGDVPLSGTFGGITFDKDGAYVFKLKDGKTQTFGKLPAGMTYTVEEEAADGFVTVKTGETGMIVKENTAKAAFTNMKTEGGLVVSKKVVSSLKADHETKFSFKVVLTDGEGISGTFGEVAFEKGESEVFKLADGEYKVITGLPEGIAYTVTEEGTDQAGFAFTVTYAGETGKIVKGKASHATVTNIRKTGGLSLTKKVKSETEADHEQTFGFTVTLTNNGEALNGEFGGYTFEKGKVLIWLKDGESAVIQQIPTGTEYMIKEEESDLYDVTILIDGKEAETVKGTITEADKTIDVIVENERKLGELKIRKSFTGIPDGSEDIIKDLRFRVFGPYGVVEDITYSKFNKDGTYTFKDLPAGEYTVYELNAYGLSSSWMMLRTSVTAGRTAVTAGETASVELKNNYKVPTTSVTVMKSWDDEEDLEGARPTTLGVTLYRGETVMAKAVLNEANGWIAEVDNLPLYDRDGNEYVYTWKEDSVRGYELVSTTVTGNFTELTNRHVPEFTSATVKKVWDDNENREELRPASLAVSLYNGRNLVKTVILSEENGWTATVDGLPVTVRGEEAKYSWTEQTVLGYRSSSAVEGNTTTFTNSIRPDAGRGPEKISLTVRKVWKDRDNESRTRPASLSVSLHNGNTLVTTVVLSEQNGWIATVEDLPVMIDDVQADYYWTEPTVIGYKSSVAVQGKITTFTNTLPRIPEPPEGYKKPKKPDGDIAIFEEYETALGVEVMINHVGDCFD